MTGLRWAGCFKRKAAPLISSSRGRWACLAPRNFPRVPARLSAEGTTIGAVYFLPSRHRGFPEGRHCILALNTCLANPGGHQTEPAEERISRVGKLFPCVMEGSPNSLGKRRSHWTLTSASCEECFSTRLRMRPVCSGTVWIGGFLNNAGIVQLLQSLFPNLPQESNSNNQNFVRYLGSHARAS